MRTVLLIASGLLLGLASTARAAVWHSDYGSAQARAYAENRIMLLYFTCSDNSLECTRVRDDIFAKGEFMTFADRHLVLVEVDFPRWKQLSVPQRQANRALQAKYQAYGYPVIVLADNEGRRLGQPIHFMAADVDTYIRSIRQRAGLSEDARPRTPDALPLFSGAPTGPPPKYKELTLKSISGTGPKKLALINNQTFTVGESGRVRLGATEIKVRCEEIRDQSVIVTIEGTPGRKELRLKTADPMLASESSPSPRERKSK